MCGRSASVASTNPDSWRFDRFQETSVEPLDEYSAISSKDYLLSGAFYFRILKWWNNPTTIDSFRIYKRDVSIFGESLMFDQSLGVLIPCQQILSLNWTFILKWHLGWQKICLFEEKREKWNFIENKTIQPYYSSLENSLVNLDLNWGVRKA